ncbi:hypothetical protein GOAMR_17_00020 [Gordonia amarae NBRC 15530]|uniref:Uncharacterized protein n=1 Tax=Gordonia amarae NBRC 15530 TaxID=1075090 RepID=G7GL02_9ACTN|nr:hypothetical protein GOAMR_17_00020 [Gordonia amarae NBRC 15530]
MNFAGAIDAEIVGMHGADLTEDLAVTDYPWCLDSSRAQMGSDCGRSDLGGCLL